MSTSKLTRSRAPEKSAGKISPGSIRCAVNLPASLATALRSAGAAHGASLPQMLAATVAVYLHRFTSARELAFAVTAAAGDRQQATAPISSQGRALPLRLAADPLERFSKFVEQVVRVWHEAEQAHRGTDGEDFPGTPIPAGADASGMSIHSIPYTAGSHFAGQSTASHPLVIEVVEDLTFHFRESEGEAHFRVELEANSDLYTTDALAAHRQRFVALLERLTTVPQGTALNQFVIVDANERRKLIEEFNPVAQPIAEATLPMLFEAQVERTPGAKAVMLGNDSWSYDELNVQANRLAHYLRSVGVGPDVPVAICLDRSIEMMTAVLAILKAGGVYVPLDPTLPEKRLSFLIGNAAAVAVVTTKSCVPLLQRCCQANSKPPLLVALDTIEWPPVSEARANPVPVNTPDHLAYILFTSGSTGQPKGVEMPHRALVNLIHWQCSASTMSAGDLTLQFASLGFDVSFQEIFSTWASGGSLVLVTDETRKDPPALFATIAQRKINRLFLPFVMLERLAEVAQDPASPRLALREVFVAGEQLRISPVIRHFFEQMLECRLGNHYGPTEAHVVTAYEMAGPPSTWPDLPSIGRPLPNCEIHLLDSAHDLVPVGGVGELCIGGVCLARGYRQRPDLTAERFVPHPFNRTPTARLYKTGDLARWQADGTIEFLGRADLQVKIRGFRIEPGEIEAALTEQPGVGQATVIARDDAQLGRHLAAYLVPAPERRIDAATVRRELAKQLPSYMVPAAIVILDALPLTPNGKVDRRALPAPQSCHHEADDTSVIPLNPLEHQLSTIWKKVFGRHIIGGQDNFFELGGHSLLAVQLTSEINRELKVTLSVLELFQYPTIRDLARVITSEDHKVRQPKLIQLQPGIGSSALFFIYQEGGVNEFRLARQLDCEGPVFATVVPVSQAALDAAARNDTSNYPSLEELAAAHVALIQEHAPSGTCALGGHSFNGLLAFEIARQLQRLGRKVDAVFLLDSELGQKPFAWWFRARIPFHLRNARERGLVYLVNKAKNNLLSHKGRNGAKPAMTPPAMALAAAELDNNVVTTWSTLEKLFIHATRHYRPQTLDSRAVLLRVHETLSGIYFNDRSLGWSRQFQQGLEIIEVPGDHFSMLENPHVQTLAKKLSAALKKIHEPGNQPPLVRKGLVHSITLLFSLKLAEWGELVECAEWLQVF